MPTPLHERKLIRDQIMAQLLNRTSAADRVVPSRSAPFRGTLPSIGVYVDNDQTDEDSADTAPRKLKRTIQVAIDCWVEATDNLEDVFDAIALEVETAMDADDFLGDTAMWSWPASTECGVTTNGNREIGCAHMVYTVVYKSPMRTVTQDATLKPLNRIGVTYKPNPSRMPVDEAPADMPQDLVTLPSP